MKRTPNPHHSTCKAVWLQFYKSRTNEDWYWTAKDAMHLNQLIKKIESKLASRSMEASTDNIANSLRAFLGSITDKWHLENLELARINSNFNSLYVKAVANSPLGVGEIRSSVEEFIRKRNNERAG